MDFDAVVSEHHDTNSSNGPWGMTELVKVSCKMADLAGFPAFPGCEARPYAEFLDELSARERRLFFPDLESLATEISEASM